MKISSKDDVVCAAWDLIAKHQWWWGSVPRAAPNQQWPTMEQILGYFNIHNLDLDIQPCSRDGTRMFNALMLRYKKPAFEMVDGDEILRIVHRELNDLMALLDQQRKGAYFWSAAHYEMHGYDWAFRWILSRFFTDTSVWSSEATLPGWFRDCVTIGGKADTVASLIEETSKSINASFSRMATKSPSLGAKIAPDSASEPVSTVVSATASTPTLEQIKDKAQD